MSKADVWNSLKESPINMTAKRLLAEYGIEYKKATEKQLSDIFIDLINDSVETVEEITEIEDDCYDFGFDVTGIESVTANQEKVNKSITELIEELPSDTKIEKTYYEQRIEELNKLYPPNSNLGQERKKLENRDLLPNTSEFNISKPVENITPKKVAITKQTSTEKTQILQERLSITESDNLIAEIGYVCLNDGVHYKGRDAVLVVKHCLSRRKDTLGNDLPPYYNQPIYCLFGQARVKRDNPVMVPISVKDKNGNWVDRMVKSDTKPDTAASVRDYMNNGKIESAGYKQAQKVQSLTLYPEKFYINDPRKSLQTKKKLEKEQELRHIIYRVSDLPEQKVKKLRSQAFKSNGELREFKTPGGYVGGTKKTKSTIKAGGKSENNTDTPIFNLSTKFRLDKLGVCQLILNTNNGFIDLINYQTGKTILRVAKIKSFNGNYYDWGFMKGIDKLKGELFDRIYHLLQPKSSDNKGVNLPKIKISEALSQRESQKVTEEKFGYHISSGTIKKAKKKAWNYLNGILNKESHPLFTAVTNEDWEKVFFILDSLGLISKS